MSNPLPVLLFLILAAAGWPLFHPSTDSGASLFAYAGWLFVSMIVSGGVRIAAQWEKALVFRLGRFRGLRGPGPFLIVPFFDTVRVVDTRILTLDIPHQEAITQDNVPVTLDGVIFLRVDDPAQAVIRIQNYQQAIRQYAQTALRDVVGGTTLDGLLADREALGKHIEGMVESEIQGWGLDVAGIRIQDIVLPEDLKRTMSRQAAAEREKRANITKSEGDREAASNLAQAASTMATSPGALQLRTLQTLDTLGGSSSNTVVLAIPVDVMTALQSVPKLVEAFVPTTSSSKTEEDAPLDAAALSQPRPFETEHDPKLETHG